MPGLSSDFGRNDSYKIGKVGFVRQIQKKMGKVERVPRIGKAEIFPR